MNTDDHDEMETKEWEEALSIVGNIISKGKRANCEDLEDPRNGILDLARWKIVWGKKPAQYRLKPFLLWSVDEMPSIQEELESPTEGAPKREEVNKTAPKIKNDKHVRLLKRKMFKMNRRIDEINVILAKTLRDETVSSLREEDPTKAAKILQLGSQKVELINERKIIKDKMQKLTKKLILLDGTCIETTRHPGHRQDVGDAPSSEVRMVGSDEQTPSQSHAPEPWSFKNGRRLAIKKEPKIPSNKPGTAKDPPRSSCDVVGDRKPSSCRKKRCCKGHHKKHDEHRAGILGESNELDKKAHSDYNLRSDSSGHDGIAQQRSFETVERLERLDKYELRESRSSEYVTDPTAGRRVWKAIAEDRPPPARASQDAISSGRGSRTRTPSIIEEAVLRSDSENAIGPQTHRSQMKQGARKDIYRPARSATDLLKTEDQKGCADPTRHCKNKRSNSAKDRAARTTYAGAKIAEKKELEVKTKTWKSVEKVVKAEQLEVSAKRTPVTNFPS